MARDDPTPAAETVLRHRLSTRLWHWTNAVALLVLLMSGLMIFNAHPRLYWGEQGHARGEAWLEIGARGDEGRLRVGALTLETTGVLGLWTDPQGIERRRAFPHWATIPSSYNLADARLWHLAFAWVLAPGLLAYLLWSLANGHLKRGIHITRAEWRPAHIWHDVREHARLRFPTGEAALRYGVLQKLAYAGVLFGLLPLVIFTGLAMSPGFDAATSVSVLFGGRQTARSLHFLVAFGLVLFVLVHLAMVLASGPVGQVRAMVTGRMRGKG